MTQRPNCTAATQAKAARLEILSINRRMAFIAGSTNDYMVDLDTLTCTCRAGQDGLHCSHVLRSLIERAAMCGYGDVTFYDDRLDARAACVAHLKAGRRAQLVEEAGYIYCQAETPPPPRVTRTRLDYNAATGLFDVVQGTAVIGQAQSYLDIEATNE